ncbi:MAG: 1-acyl-sn-glycerol-3-phosphate acyltransferase [Xanthobacteraceae bacterium]|nr:1-acyl-sn-glycerol-3-phosphate acyltransferase [Xanthobacteraceae bacterium]
MIRAVVILPLLVLTFLVLVPFHLIGRALNNDLQRSVPVFFHRIACALLGVRIHQTGKRSNAEEVLILSNHVSWLDISVLSAVAPIVFVSKSEVANWPIFGTLARLQRTVFIDRERRHKTGEAAGAMAERLRGGDAVVLFPEGTSSDGIRILPFRSALIGAVHHTIGDATHKQVVVQPVSIAYVRFGGIPIGRALRDKVAWYGETDLMPHFFGVIAAGAIDVVVSWGEPVAYDVSANRKHIARNAETAVRRMTAEALRGAPQIA